MDGALPVPALFLKKKIHATDIKCRKLNNISTSTTSTPVQKVHRKPVPNLKSSPTEIKLNKNYVEADTIHPNRLYQRTRRYSQGSCLIQKQEEPPVMEMHPRASMSTLFWYPRTESQTEPLEPLKRGLSKKLRGLLLPRRTFVERGLVNNTQYVQDYHVSLQRCVSPTTVTACPFSTSASKKWDDKEFVQIDNYVSTVQQRGPLLTPALLSQKFLIRPYRKDLFRLRALFIWLVHNVRPEYHMRRRTELQQWILANKKKKRIAAIETHCQKPHTMHRLQEEAMDLLLDQENETPEHVLEKRTCKSSVGMAQLFVAMAQAAGFRDAKVIYGYLKGPKDTISMTDQTLPLNHAWCSVKIEGEYRMIDCWLASPYYPQNDKVESHWFLCTPTDMILTHLPKHPQQQYLTTPIHCSEFFKLPYVRHHFFLYPMRILHYQTSVQEDDGLFYISFQLNDRNVTCFAETESEKDGTLIRGLAQCTIDDQDRRIFKVKGVLPPHESSGWLKIYLGPKLNQQQYEDEEQLLLQEEITTKIHYPLSMCIYIQQKPIPSIQQKDMFEFVKIYVDHNEFYINEPQCYQLYPLQTYRFSIKANRIDYYYNRSTHYKLAIKSPNGKLYKIMYYPQDQTYDGHVTISEPGRWSLVCLLHNTGGSYTVASWICKIK